MPKLRVSCRDCACFEGSAGLALGLCWRPYDGPQVVGTAPDGFCGNEWLEGGGLTPRELWQAGHAHRRGRLDEVLILLRLASAGTVVPPESDAPAMEVAGDEVTDE